MNLGTDSKNKTIAAVALGVLAFGMVVYRFINPSGSSPSAASPVVGNSAPVTSRTTTKRTTTASNSNNPRGKKVEASLDPTLQLDLLRSIEETKYSGNGRNIFVPYVDIPKPVDTGVKKAEDTGPPPPPQPPPPPPITLKFFGFANKPGEPKKIFLSQDGDVFIAGEGEIVNRRYRILHIGTSSVEIEDVLNNNRQTIPLTQG